MMDLFQALTNGDTARPALIWRGQTITRRDLFDRAGRIAAALDVAPGERICAQIDKSPDAVALYLACLSAGAVLVPFNTDYTADELTYLIGDAEPAVVVCRPAMADAVGAIAGAARCLTLDEDGGGALAELAGSLPAAMAGRDIGADSLASIIYTSGTTGRPKGAMLTRVNLHSNAATLVDIWGIAAEDRLVHALPIYHVHGLFVALNTILMAGASAFFLPRFDATDVVELLPQATLMMGVPTHYSRLLQADALEEAVRGMRLFISGSAPLSVETHRQFEARTGHIILERYGMSEAGMITSNPLAGARKPGTVGPPLPGVELRVVNEAGHPVASGDIGMVEIRGPNLFAGYWRAGEKTAEAMRPDGFFVTGDLGSLDAHGYLTIAGRGKDLIITGGLNVYPAEIENLIDAVPGVAESAVIGVPHPDFGEAVVAVVSRRAGQPADAEALLAEVAPKLARFKHPKWIVFTDALPRNAMGKINKVALREAYRDIFAGIAM